MVDRHARPGDGARTWRLGPGRRGFAGRVFAVLLALSSAAMTPPTSRAAEDPRTQPPQLEARVNRLAEELRCMVCQNQSLADSHAPLAVDLKNQVRAQLAQGRSEAEVRDYLVLRYGDFVLYRPPLKPDTWLLWFAPLGLVLAGLALLGRRWYRTRGLPGDADEVHPDIRHHDRPTPKTPFP